MSNATYALILVSGAALLALWLDLRLPTLAPAGLRAIVLHAALALGVVHLIPGDAASPAGVYLALFGIALPALIYVFLVAIWFIRHAQSALGSSFR
ncbi:MAG TPA: hypothetical protein VNI55_13435 [Gaiellaceae bacterium]|nr:hypothetical protein [Gaiellaceae bacterium]